MKKMWLTSSDGENQSREFRWVVFGDPKGCVLFDRSYSYKGHAVRRAKKLIIDQKATVSCVSKPQNGNFYTVHYGNEFTSFLMGEFE